MEAKIIEHKKAITASKPLDSQLVSCNAAPNRAKAKLDEHTAEAMKHNALADDLRVRVAELEHDKVRLKSRIVSAEPTETNSVAAMSSALSTVLDQMVTSGIVPQAVVAEARRRMEELVIGVQAVASRSQKTVLEPVLVYPAASDASNNSVADMHVSGDTVADNRKREGNVP